MADRFERTAEGQEVEYRGKGSDYEKMKIAVLRDIASSGGVGFARGRLSLEVLFLLPKEFTDWYTELFFTALKEDAAGTQVDQTGVTSVPSKLRGKKGSMAAQGGGKRYKNAWLLRDERALHFKQGIDRELRGIAAKIELAMGGSDGGSGKRKFEGNLGKTGVCGGCKKFVGAGDKYCRTCGTKVTRMVREIKKD